MLRGDRLPFAITLAIYTLLFLFTFHEADEDVWGRIAAGRLTVSEGQVPERDVFAYVPTKPRWVDHEWLSGVIFYEVHRSFGGRGLLVLRAVVGAAAMAFLFKAARAANPWTVALLSIAVWPLIAQGFNSVVRAQAFTFLFFAASLFVLERGKARLALVPLTALWSNLHGGFVLGPLLLVAYGSYGLGAAAFAASVLNPYGIHYWRYLGSALWMPRPEIVEWRPAELLGIGDLHVQGALLLALVLLWEPERPKRSHLIALAGAGLASLLHVRFAPLLGMVIIVTLALSWERLFEKRRHLPALGAMTAALGLVFIGLTVAWSQRDFSLQMRVPEDRYPVAAVERLKAERGNLAVYFNWGEYALYHLYPGLHVSIDGRYETVYPDEVVRANWDFTRGVPGSEKFLQTYSADFALYPWETGAARWLEGSSSWDLLYKDGFSVLYRRRE
ncbi:MAG: hypothetical protein ACRD3V_02240 [Vicinamibacteria bacterium]